MPTQSSLSYRLRPFLVADSKLPTQPFWLPTQSLSYPSPSLSYPTYLTILSYLIFLDLVLSILSYLIHLFICYGVQNLVWCKISLKANPLIVGNFSDNNSGQNQG